MMDSSPTPGRAVLPRRSFLAAMGLGATAVGSVGALAGCSGSAASSTPTSGGQVSADVLPAHVAVNYVEPDIPAEQGAEPGYTHPPQKLVQSVKSPPGTGRTFTAMTPLWGTIPPSKGNQYYEAVNKMLGDTIHFQISDGNTYGDKLAAVLASPKDVPDWVQIPGWNVPPRFGSEIVEHVFTDLTPYLAGDAVNKYPNLANLPTDSWRACVWNGKLYGIPFPDVWLRNGIFYRDDLFATWGITVDVHSADDMLALMKRLTAPGKNRWATEDPWNAAVMMYAVPDKWRLDDSGKLINRVETPEYREALEWSAKVFSAGVVHPDAVAGKTDGAKTRFQSGRSVIMFDGLGGWNEALRDNLGDNPSYSQRPFDPIDGKGGTPVRWKGAGAGMYSFLKQTDDKAKVEELLALANAIAAPFGTTEYQLINYGVEGVHYKLGSDGIPKPTPLAGKEIQPTYIFLADPPVVESHYQYPGFVKKFCTWMNNAVQYVKEPLFYGLNIEEPAEYASISQPFTDLEASICRGRKSMKDLDQAIKTWKSSGGDQLRAFYQKILDKQDSQ